MLDVYFSLVAVVAIAVGFVVIVRKAGYSGWWALLGLVPVVNVVMFAVFAFRQWPISREVVRLRAATNTANSQDYLTLLSMALSAERQGDLAQASELFGLLASNCQDEEVVANARQNLERISRDAEITADLGNPYRAGTGTEL